MNYRNHVTLRKVWINIVNKERKTLVIYM